MCAGVCVHTHTHYVCLCQCFFLCFGVCVYVYTHKHTQTHVSICGTKNMFSYQNVFSCQNFQSHHLTLHMSQNMIDDVTENSCKTTHSSSGTCSSCRVQKHVTKYVTLYPHEIDFFHAMLCLKRILYSVKRDLLQCQKRPTKVCSTTGMDHIVLVTTCRQYRMKRILYSAFIQ